MNVRHLTPRPPEDRSKRMAEHMKTMQSMAGDMGARHQMMEKRMEMIQTVMKMMMDRMPAAFARGGAARPRGPAGELHVEKKAVVSVCRRGGRGRRAVLPLSLRSVAAENFQQKLFIPGASGPFGVLEAIPADPPWQFQNLTW